MSKDYEDDMIRAADDIMADREQQRHYRRRAWYWGKRRRAYLRMVINALPPGHVFYASDLYKILEVTGRPNNWPHFEWFQETTVERILIEFAGMPKPPIEGKKARIPVETTLDGGAIMVKHHTGWVFRKPPPLDTQNAESEDRESSD